MIGARPRKGPAAFKLTRGKRELRLGFSLLYLGIAMNIEADRDSAKKASSSDRRRRPEEPTGSRQIKLVFVAALVVTVVWVAVLFYLGGELLRRALG